MFKNNLSTLRLIAYLEGISFLVLVGISMPLKYMYAMPKATLVPGMVHGILFMIYCAMVIVVRQEQKWSFGKTFWALLASILPFGTFVADAKLFRKA